MASKKKLALIHQEIKTPLFHVHYQVYMGWDMDKMVDHANEMFPGIDLNDYINRSHYGYSATLRHSHGHSFLLFIRMQENERDVIRTIVHEGLHLTWHVLDAVGVKLDSENHETQAYLLEDIHSQLLDMYEVAKEKLEKP